MDLKFVIINGFPAAGKDTFITMCGEYTPTVTMWTSAPAKRALKTLGWDGIKTPETRRLLSELKALSVKEFDGVAKYLDDEIEYIRHFFAPGRYIIFIHSREPEEIKRLAKKYNALTLLVIRNVNQEELTNDSDRNVLDYHYDYTVDNTGDLDQLQLKAKDFVDFVREVL